MRFSFSLVSLRKPRSRIDGAVLWLTIVIGNILSISIDDFNIWSKTIANDGGDVCNSIVSFYRTASVNQLLTMAIIGRVFLQAETVDNLPFHSSSNRQWIKLITQADRHVYGWANERRSRSFDTVFTLWKDLPLCVVINATTYLLRESSTPLKKTDRQNYLSLFTEEEEWKIGFTCLSSDVCHNTHWNEWHSFIPKHRSTVCENL